MIRAGGKDGASGKGGAGGKSGEGGRALGPFKVMIGSRGIRPGNQCGQGCLGHGEAERAGRAEQAGRRSGQASHPNRPRAGMRWGPLKSSDRV